MWVCSTCAQCRSFRAGRQAGVGLLQAAAVCRLSSEQQVPAAWQLLHCECGLFCHQRRTQLCSSVLQCVLSVRLTFLCSFLPGFRHGICNTMQLRCMCSKRASSLTADLFCWWNAWDGGLCTAYVGSWCAVLSELGLFGLASDGSRCLAGVCS